jgi:cytoskeletal protein CcmA (bactofilin family)
VVEGDLRTREAVLGGEVHGQVVASERVEVQPTAAVHGDIITPRLLIQEGGRVNGGVRMESTAEVAVNN